MRRVSADICVYPYLGYAYMFPICSSILLLFVQSVRICVSCYAHAFGPFIAYVCVECLYAYCAMPQALDRAVYPLCMRCVWRVCVLPFVCVRVFIWSVRAGSFSSVFTYYPYALYS